MVADVGRQEDVARIAAAAIGEFGRFDTWVNNAGVSIFGEIPEVSVEDMHRVFDTVYWGVVHGCLQAVEHYRNRADDAGGRLAPAGQPHRGGDDEPGARGGRLGDRLAGRGRSPAAAPLSPVAP